jgi:hypothetical protein
MRDRRNTMNAEILTKLQSHQGYRGWRIRPYPPSTAVFLAETYTVIGRGNRKGWRSLWDGKQGDYRTFATPEQVYDALLAMQQELEDLEARSSQNASIARTIQGEDDNGRHR